jgi:hypothetical protein
MSGSPSATRWRSTGQASTNDAAPGSGWSPTTKARSASSVGRRATVIEPSRLGGQPGGADEFGEHFVGPQSADIRFVGIEGAGQALQHTKGTNYPEEALK